MVIKKLSIFFAFAMVMVASSGCTSTKIDSRNVESGSARETLANISGSYKLITVNGATIPATVSHGDAQVRVHSGVFIIRANGTCTSNTVFSPPSGGKLTRKMHATYTSNGPNLVMQWKGAGVTRGNIDNGTFTMDNHGMTFVYLHSGEIVPGLKLDLADECADATGIDKAQVGVFDDFNTALQSGRDRGRFPIGFYTFQGSGDSLVSISTTSEHPRRAGEDDDNEVLQMDLDVKAWSGIIHSFENAAVSRWAPRDWRGFSELRFWLYGNNTNTALFVEILDNRKPCPTSGGAEVYTYTFADNFSGWKQITVPFEKLDRKEIYNDAPNDGLGLSEVHGWAFGTLNTDGPITYYIDDFELRKLQEG